MSQEDLDMLVAPYGVKLVKIGESELKVRRVLLRGQAKTVRAAQTMGTQIGQKLQEILGQVTSDMTDETKDRLVIEAELVEEEFRLALVSAVRAMVVGDVPMLDEFPIESVSVLFAALSEAQESALVESLVGTLPSSGV